MDDRFTVGVKFSSVYCFGFWVKTEETKIRIDWSPMIGIMLEIIVWTKRYCLEPSRGFLKWTNGTYFVSIQKSSDMFLF